MQSAARARPAGRRRLAGGGAALRGPEGDPGGRSPGSVRAAVPRPRSVLQRLPASQGWRRGPPTPTPAQPLSTCQRGRGAASAAGHRSPGRQPSSFIRPGAGQQQQAQGPCRRPPGSPSATARASGGCCAPGGGRSVAISLLGAHAGLMPVVRAGTC